MASTPFIKPHNTIVTKSTSQQLSIYIN